MREIIARISLQFILAIALTFCVTTPSFAKHWIGANSGMIGSDGCSLAQADHDWTFPQDGFVFLGCGFSPTYVGANYALECTETYCEATHFGGAMLRCDEGESSEQDGCIKDQQPRARQCKVGDPIDILSGETAEYSLDYQGSGATPIRIERYYSRNGRSENPYFENSSIGRGWRTGFDSKLYIYDGNTSQIILPDGRELYFTKVGSQFQLAYFDPAILRFRLYTTSVPEKFIHSPSSPTYELTLKDGTVYVYSDETRNYRDDLDLVPNGSLVEIRPIDGNKIRLTYNRLTSAGTIQGGKLYKVTDSANRQVTFSYDFTANKGLLTGISVDGVQVVNYAYKAGLADSDFPSSTTVRNYFGVAILKSVVYPQTSGEKITYGYDDPNNRYALTSETDGLGFVYTTWTYDATTGRAVSSQHVGGVDKTTIDYDDAGKLITVTNALGKKAQLQYTDSAQRSRLQTSVNGLVSANCAASNTSYEYDANEYTSKTTDPEGRVTTYVTNDLGLPTTITRGFGTASAETVTLTWDMTLRKPLTVVRPSLTTTYAWNPNGTLHTVTQTDTASQTVPYSTNGQTRTWTYGYDAQGVLLRSVDGPLAGTGDTTKYTYTTAGYLQTVTDPVGLVTTVAAWNSRGQPTSVTDPNGIQINYSYDGMGRLTEVMRDMSVGAPSNPAPPPEVWDITYDTVGNVTKITEPTGAYHIYSYDGARRLTKVKNALGETLNYTNDDLSHVLTAVTKTGGATPTTTYQSTNTYDELGRLIRLTTGQGHDWQVGWDRSDQLVSVTDPRSNSVAFGLDAVGRVTSRTNEDGGVEGVAYDADGRVASYVDPRSLATTYIRNGFGDVIQEVSPDRGTTVYQVDGRGLRTQKTDARGVVTNYTYDAAGRLISRTFPASSAEDVTFTWGDQVVHPPGAFYDRGRLVNMTDRAGTTTWTWDKRGRITKEVRAIGIANSTVTYTWDSAGHLSGVTYPSGRQVTYGYDVMAQVVSVTTKSPAAAGGVTSTIASSALYLPFGGIKSAAFGNGLTWSKTFDLDGNVGTIQLAPTAGGTALFNRAHPIPDGMNIAKLDDAISSSQDITLTYDAANRVTSARIYEPPWTTYTWTYDQAGNRLSETVTPSGGSDTTSNYNYPPTSNQLSTVTQGATTLRSLLYANGSGDITTDTRQGVATVYAYDNGERLRAVTVGGVRKSTYTYDGMDRLSIRSLVNQTPSGYTYFIHMVGGGGAFDDLMPDLGRQIGALGNRVIAETSSAGASLREYIWLGDMIIAVIDNANTATPTTYWVTNDHLGRPVQMTSATKTIVWRAKYRAFGEVSSITGTASLDARFPGQWFQLESGLAYNWHRHYDASIGRYTQPDPLGVKAGPNVYGYADGNPVMEVDPEGRADVKVGPPGLLTLIPPMAIPGTPENKAWTNWAMGIVNEICAPSQDLPQVRPKAGDSKDSGIDCERLYSDDTATCNAIAKRRGGAAGERCHASATQRYAACMRGRSIPPLDTWNN